MLFFFSSRRRHTRSKRDWSSDVCSSDLVRRRPVERSRRDAKETQRSRRARVRRRQPPEVASAESSANPPTVVARSEERRVGKEGSSRRWREPGKKKEREA